MDDKTALEAELALQEQSIMKNEEMIKEELKTIEDQDEKHRRVEVLYSDKSETSIEMKMGITPADFNE